MNRVIVKKGEYTSPEFSVKSLCSGQVFYRNDGPADELYMRVNSSVDGFVSLKDGCLYSLARMGEVIGVPVTSHLTIWTPSDYED